MLFSGASLQSIMLNIAYRLPALLIGLSFHEAAHAYMAYRCGDPTARNLGRMSLDPLRHLDPIGTLTLLLFGFGWAKPVPINTRNFRNPRRDEIFVSLAGIITNLVLAFIFTGVFYLLYALNVHEIVLTIVYVIVQINIVLAIFNLIPIPPLDGYHVLKNSINGGYRFFATIERYSIFFLIGIIMLISRTGILGVVINAMFRFFSSFYEMFI